MTKRVFPEKIIFMLKSGNMAMVLKIGTHQRICQLGLSCATAFFIQTLAQYAKML